VVISIVDQVAKQPGYHLSVADIRRWENRRGRIPEGAVVFVRSDWSRVWPDPALATRRPFPGVSLPALRFLHEQRRILFHGHEPLDTDTTDTLEGEAWLLHHGYTEAEGVAHLDQVPEAGALVAIGYPKFQGGLGGYARFIAICPPDWKYGVSVGEVPEARSRARTNRCAGIRRKECACADASAPVSSWNHFRAGGIEAATCFLPPRGVPRCESKPSPWPPRCACSPARVRPKSSRASAS
jgi:hypothetical protein